MCIFAPNSEKWMIMEIGAMMHGLTLVPLYDTLGPESIEYVLNQTKASTLSLVAKHLDKILKLKEAEKLPHLKNLVLIDFGKEDAKNAADHFNLYTYDELI